MPLCRSCRGRVDSEEPASAGGRLGPDGPLVGVDGRNARAPASGAREAERRTCQATAGEVPCACVRLARRVRAT